MEQFIAAAGAELLKYGLPGIFIGYLIFRVWRLEGDIKQKDKTIAGLQEMRINEAIRTVITLGATAVSGEKMAEAIGAMDARLHENNERLAELSGRIGE